MKKILKIIFIIALIPIMLIGVLRGYGLRQRELAKKALESSIYSFRDGKEVNIIDQDERFITLASKNASVVLHI